MMKKFLALAILALASRPARAPGPTPIDKAHWRFRIAQQAKIAQYEAETSGYLADVGYERIYAQP